MTFVPSPGATQKEGAHPRARRPRVPAGTARPGSKSQSRGPVPTRGPLAGERPLGGLPPATANLIPHHPTLLAYNRTVRAYPLEFIEAPAFTRYLRDYLDEDQ
jgi:hypothetical protein